MNETFVVLVRSVIAFTTLLIYCRLLGKEQIKHLTFFDYVAGITIGSIAATMSTNLANRAWPEFVGLTAWLVLTFFLEWVTVRSRYMAKIIDGEPLIVIMNGQIMEDAMHKARLKLADLLGLLRMKDVFDLTQVEFAVYEKDGTLSVLKKTEFQPVTAKDLNLSTKYQGIGTELVYDGKVMEQNLQDIGLNKSWLTVQLAKLGVQNPSDVFLAYLSTEGQLYVDKYQDHLVHTTDLSDYEGPN